MIINTRFKNTVLENVLIINLSFLHRPGFRGSESHQDHIQAEQYGRSYGSCWSAYPDCPISMREQLYHFFINNANIEEKNSS